MSPLLETLIGLAFFYTLFSLLASALVEAVSRVFALRAGNLTGALRAFLGDSKQVDAFFKHPLIVSVAPQGWFTRLLGGEFQAEQAPRERVRFDRLGMLKRYARPSYLSSRIFAIVVLDLLAADGDKTDPALSSLQKKIDPLLRYANPAFKLAIGELERQFDEQMNRASGWYKRKAHLLLVCIGVGVCMALNFDTLQVADILLNDAGTRAAVVALAEWRVANAAESLPSNVAALRAVIDDTGMPLGWACERPGTAQSALLWQQPVLALARLACAESADADSRHVEMLRPPVSLQGWWRKMLGLLISMIAIAQGAPFWFDLLGRFVNLRGAGPKPAISEGGSG
jgi:hypothetical protein